VDRPTQTDQPSSTAMSPCSSVPQGCPIPGRTAPWTSAVAESPVTISRQEMAAHIRSGRARPWTRQQGSHRLVWDAALLGDTWYTVMRDTDHYQKAPGPFAALLTVLDATTLNPSEFAPEHFVLCRSGTPEAL
jgi:hypothetical protein